MVIVPKEEASRLISEIYRRPILWDRKHASFHNRNLADSVWMEVSQIMNHPKKILKIKWKSLRDTFRGELRKQAFYEKTNISRSMWIHYNSMTFLAEQMVPRQPAWERSSTRRYRGRAWIAGSNDFIDGNSPSPSTSGQQSPTNEIASPSDCADSPDLVECSEMEANDCEDSTEPPQLHFEACDVLDVVDMLSAGLMNANDNDPIEIDASSSPSTASTAHVCKESQRSQSHRPRSHHHHQHEQEQEKNERRGDEREEQQLLLQQQGELGEQQLLLQQQQDQEMQHRLLQQQTEQEEQQQILQQQLLQEEQQLLLQQQQEHEDQLLLLQQQKIQEDHQRQQAAYIMKEEEQVVDGYGVINLHGVEGKSRTNVPIIQHTLPEQVLVEAARIPCGQTIDSQDSENRFDDNYYFFMSLLPHIRTLPADRRMLLRMQMQNLVYEEVYKKNVISLQISNVVSTDERANSSTVSSSSNLERHNAIASVSLSGVNQSQ